MTGTDPTPIPVPPKPFNSLPPAFQKRILELESELDRVHPGWRDTRREARRFDDKLLDEIYRIKFLLKRRDLLLHGHDWPVMMTVSANGKMWFAHPMNPADVRVLNEVPVIKDEAIGDRLQRTRETLAAAGSLSAKEIDELVLDLEARLLKEASEQTAEVRLNPRNEVPRNGVQQ